MKKFISKFVCVIMATCLFSCAEDSDLLKDIPLTGNLMGVVKDATDGHLLSTVNVSLTPDNKSCVTDNDGSFNFKALKSGSYTLTFKKVGYDDAVRTVEAKAGETIDASVTMSAKAAFAISTNSLDFGDMNANMSFVVVNNSDAQTFWEIKNVPAWASFSQTSETVSAQGSSSISVMVNRDKVDYGEYTQNVVINYKGKSEGSVTVTLSMKKVKLSAPEVSISEQATEVTKNSFVIKGQLQATGGSAVTDYGHCWSLTPNPTIEGQRSSNGSTQQCDEFSTTVSGLTVGTIYYVRAYAVNAQGISYSNQVSVMTLEAESNKWDGTKAKEFAGGTGSSVNPYKIETGAQLLLMMDYPTDCFELTSNIDLDNKNWKPIPDFNGEFDGAGYTISNLYINRTDDHQGLFASIGDGAVIQNLNIKGVNINAGNCNYIGALAGSVGVSSVLINNINVTLIDDSQILGNHSVGGIVGSCCIDSRSQFMNCHVFSTSTDYTIKGSKTVGGICGYAAAWHGESNIEGCIAEVSVKGGDETGGIVGRCNQYLGEYLNLKSCGFKGKVSGHNYVGGIAGYNYTQDAFIACKADAEISGSDYVGGISGYNGKGLDVIACYTSGSIDCPSNRVSGLCVVCNWSFTSYLSYTTMSVGLNRYCCDCATTSSTGGGTNVKTNCTDITTHLREAYSEYADYWDFERTWIWTGEIDGKEVKVSCPKLKWE